MNGIITNMVKCWFMNADINPSTGEFYFNQQIHIDDIIIAGTLGSFTELTKETFNTLQISNTDKVFRKCQLRLFKYIQDTWYLRCKLLFNNN